MKKQVKFFIVIVVIIIIVVLAFLGLKNDENKVNKDKNQEENNQSIVNVLPSIIDYTSLDELNNKYTIEEAINDKCFVIDNRSNTYNNEYMDNFYNSVKDNKSSNIRIVELTMEEGILILDINYENEIMTITEDYSRNPMYSGERIVNTFDMKEFTFLSDIELLEDGNEKIVYYLISNTNLEEKYYLCGYLKNSITYDENLPNDFECIVKEISSDYIIVEPKSNTTEEGVSKVIEVMINKQVINQNIIIGDALKVFYKDGITKENEKYIIKDVVFIEKIN